MVIGIIIKVHFRMACIYYNYILSKSGIGIWYLTNNSEFEGFFDNDLPHGQGTIRRI